MVRQWVRLKDTPMDNKALLKNLQPPVVPLAVLQDFAETTYGLRGDWPVSYTHLDVYKRQPHGQGSFCADY